jgi:hypothetical protein
MFDFENGINGATGKYLFPSLSAAEIANIFKADLDRSKDLEAHRNELKERAKLKFDSKAPAAWVDPTDLSQSGWGVIFANEYHPYTIEQLKSDDGIGLLLKHRRQQATQQNDRYYRECTYQPTWDKSKFLTQHKVPASGAIDPDRGMPYYLLIIGDPASIPYDFQYQLDVQYAVGRIYFDTLAEYANYASSIIAAETQPPIERRRIDFWGVSNSGDTATQLSTKHLVTPLSTWVKEKHPTWETRSFLAETATKANLSQIIHGDTPAILFTASHGVGYPKDDPQQRELQGALVCQEWQPFLGKPNPEKHLFAAADIGTDANLHGTIVLEFACYGLGTPQFNNFVDRGGDAELAAVPFISRLPQALIGRDRGSALAVIGHVDRAFSNSFRNQNINQLSVFQSLLTGLFKNWPVGYAMEFFNQHYAELASDCAASVQKNNTADLAAYWHCSNNARNYAILGDPAVRLNAISQDSQAAASSREVRPIVWLEANHNVRSPELATRENPQKTAESLEIERLEKEVKMLREEVADLKQKLAEITEKS